MRDPDLVQRAEMAATALEQAWVQWITRHGLGTGPLPPPVSSYVGYSMGEPWGQPRVVFGMDAEQAERLTEILNREPGAETGRAEAAATADRQSQGTPWSWSVPGAAPGVPTQAAEPGLARPEPAQRAAAGYEPAACKPVRTGPAPTEPSSAEPPRAELPRAEAPRTELPRTEAPRTELPRAEPPRPASGRYETDRFEPERYEPARYQPTRFEAAPHAPAAGQPEHYALAAGQRERYAPAAGEAAPRAQAAGQPGQYAPAASQPGHYAPAQGYEPAQGHDQAQGYDQAQDYDQAQGYGPARRYEPAQRVPVWTEAVPGVPVWPGSGARVPVWSEPAQRTSSPPAVSAPAVSLPAVSPAAEVPAARSARQVQPAQPVRYAAAPVLDATELAADDLTAEQPILPLALRRASAIPGQPAELPDEQADALQELAAKSANRPGIVALRRRQPEPQPEAEGTTKPWWSPGIKAPAGPPPEEQATMTRLSPVSKLNRMRKPAPGAPDPSWPGGGAQHAPTDTAV